MTRRRLTQRRDLRTGSALWASGWGSRVPVVAPRGDIFADVAVIGAGISGALMARALQARGQDVVVLDRRRPVHGSTMASTALLQFEIDLPLAKLADRIGTAAARRAWHRSHQAVQRLIRIVAADGIRCGLRTRSSLYLAGTTYGARFLRHEVEERTRAGLPGEFVSGADLRSRFGIGRTGAIASTGNATANPVQLAAGLLRRVIARGGRVFAPADVQEVASDSAGVVLGLAGGQSVIARHAVFCTGYELLAAIPLHGHTVKSTWAIATAPLKTRPDWLGSTLVWEASSPYLYLRTTHDGRLVAGGEDEDSATRHEVVSSLRLKRATIARKVRALLPELGDVTPSHIWAGAFGESPTGLPLIGAVPGLPRCYAVAGFGGNGITHSVIASEVVSHAIHGQRDVDGDLFRLSR